jgi:hypothetical protein
MMVAWRPGMLALGFMLWRDIDESGADNGGT